MTTRRGRLASTFSRQRRKSACRKRFHGQDARSPNLDGAPSVLPSNLGRVACAPIAWQVHRPAAAAAYAPRRSLRR